MAFKDIDKGKFFTLCAIYSLADAVLFHPFSVAAVVAELHRVPSALPAAPRSFVQQLRASFQANLTIRQAVDKIVKASPASGRMSALFTGFPITCTGLILYDVFQMLPYNYFKSWLKEQNVPTFLPIPVLSGVLSTLLCTPFVNPPTVLFRQQVQHRCMGQPYDLGWIFHTRLPAMEGGRMKVLFRGSLVGIVTAVPATALSWQLYETSRQRLETHFNSQSVYLSVLSGAFAGVVGVTCTRPISVVVSRMQTDSQSHGFWATAKTLFKAEGPGAFYKGYMARILATAPRNGIFFSAYQSIITLSKRPPEKKEFTRGGPWADPASLD